MQLDLGFVLAGQLEVGHLAALERAHGAIEHFGVEREADFFDLAGLFFAEQLAGAADFEIVRREREAGAELFERRECFEALFGIGGDDAPIRHDEIRVRAVMRAPDASAQLMQLREAEPIGAIDDDRVRARHVDAGFDDRRADEHVEALPVEIEHDLFELALGHLAVRDAEARFGEQLAELARGLFDRVDFVVQEIHLAAARELALERLADQRRIVDADECLHGEPVLRAASR